jgi:hypothetical protein
MLLNAALGAAFLFAGAASVPAETPVERAMRTVRDVCAIPTQPGGILASARALAEREGWGLVNSGPAPLPFQPRSGDPDTTDFAAWKVPLEEGGEMKVRVQVVNPELLAKSEPTSSGLIFDACLVSLPEDADEVTVQAAVDAAFGKTVERYGEKAPTGATMWHFTDRMALGDCSKSMFAGGIGIPAIQFIDVVLPRGAPGSDRPWLPCRPSSSR